MPLTPLETRCAAAEAAAGPIPAVFSLEEQNRSLRARFAILVAVLNDLLEHFEELEDADHDGEKFVPNEAMHRAGTIREAFERAGVPT